MRSASSFGLQQTRCFALTSAGASGSAPFLAALSGVSAGWQAMDPLSATQMTPVSPHSRMQWGPPTRTAVLSGRTSSVGTLSMCLIFIVAASMRKTSLQNWRLTQRWPGHLADSDRLCRPPRPSPFSPTGPTCHASWSSRSMPPGQTGMRTSTLLDIWLTKTHLVTGS